MQRIRLAGRPLVRRPALMGMLLAAGLALRAAPLPTGADLRGGQAAVSAAGDTLTVHQTSARAVINWASFDIAAGQSVRTTYQQWSGDVAIAWALKGGDAQADAKQTASRIWFSLNRSF